MTVEGKDQEMSQFEKWVQNKEFEKAYKWLNKTEQSSHNKLFNTAFIKYHEGKLPEARAILEKLKYDGFVSKELLVGIHEIKTGLDLHLIESEYTKDDNFYLVSSSLPSYFYPSISVTLIFFALFFAARKNFIIGTIFILSALPFGWAYNEVKSFQVEINTEEVTIYRGPSKIFEEVQVLPPGVQFIATKRSKEWRYIEYPSLFKGWVKKVKAIKQ